MSAKRTFLLVLMVLVLSTPAVFATNATVFSVSELGYTGPQQIAMYCSGVYIDTYNTSADSIPLPDCDFMLVIKPEASSYVKNPENLLNEVFAIVQTNFVPLIFIMFLISILYLGRR